MKPDADKTVHRCIEIAREERLEDHGASGADEAFEALFRLTEQPRPRPGFALRAVRAARRAPLPAGRHALARPLNRAAWVAAGIAGTVFAAYGAVVALQPVAVRALAGLVTFVTQAGLWSLQSVGSGIGIWGVLAGTGRAFGTALTTREGSTATGLTVFVGAFALAALHRLLFPEKESSPW